MAAAPPLTVTAARESALPTDGETGCSLFNFALLRAAGGRVPSSQLWVGWCRSCGPARGCRKCYECYGAPN